MNQETIIDTLSWFKILPLNGSSLIRVKVKLYRIQKSLRKFLEPSGKPKVIYNDNSLEFANPVKVYHGIIGRQHLVDLRRVALLNEQYEESKEHQLFCCSQDWTREGGPILWNAIVICETFKTSWRRGKLFVKGHSENHFKGPISSIWSIGGI